MPKKVFNLSEKFAESTQLRIGEVESLRDRVAHLEALLAKTQEVQKIPLSKIRVNPNQPRTSFYVVKQKIDTLRRDGQKTPIILVQPPGVDYFLIFDGECRFRGAQELNWETIDAIFIPYDPETFDRDVLVSSIHSDGLNSLDLAINLAKEIKRKIPALDSKIIPTKLNSALIRLRRKGEYEKLKGLEKEDFEKQQEILTSLNLSAEELVIFSTILDFRQNLGSISNHKFPFLNCSPEVIQAIRDYGLGDPQALAIDSIKPTNKKLDISEEEAKDIRLEMIASCLEYNLNLPELKKEIQQLIEPFLKNPQSDRQKVFKKIVAQAESIQTKDLNKEERTALIKVLKGKIKELSG